MALIDNVKASLRIVDPSTSTPASTARTADIQELIDAAKDELTRNGWLITTDTDKRVIMAVTLFVKGQLDYQTKGDRYMQLFREYVNGTSLDQSYITPAPEPEEEDV